MRKRYTQIKLPSPDDHDPLPRRPPLQVRRELAFLGLYASASGTAGPRPYGG